MALAKELSIMLENKRGALAELCSALARVAVNIQALMVPEQPGVAPLRLVVNNLDAARKVLSGLGLKFTEQDVIAARVSDRPGALGKLTRKLADHNLDVKYAYGSILKGSGDAIIILAISDVAAAAKIA
ncbi:MAG TPA: amino acid-binding protein [Terriglobia bacterium]|nr:amino acid-binding protein [Terriglobia bacterium]